MFVLFKSNGHLKYFQEFLNSRCLSLFTNKVNLQPQFIVNVLLVTFKSFLSSCYKLVWYTPDFVDAFVFAWIG